MKDIPKKKSRFMAFLSSLCSTRPSNDRSLSKDKKKCKLKVNKVPRLTFQLDRVLVKLSRKNVAQQQFMQNQVLTFHLEKYLISRFKECDIVAFSGQFSNFLTEKIPYSIQIKFSKQEVFQGQNNNILSNLNSLLKFRQNTIDALAFQLYFGQKEQQCKKSDNSQKTQVTKQISQIEEQLDKIQRILRLYNKKISNFMFICHKDMKLQDIHNLFLVFRQKYMFEFERVKKIQKTICNIVYISNNNRFLKIDNLSLCEYFMTEFDRIKAFDDEKINLKRYTLKQQQMTTKKQNKKTENNLKQINSSVKSQQTTFTLKQISRRQAFNALLQKIFEKNLHLQASQALATILEYPQKKSNKIQWFLDLMKQRYPQSKELIQNYKIDPEEQKQQEMNKTSSQFTPIFAAKSNYYSKMTALFRTHSGKDEDDFMICERQEGQQDVQF